MLLLRAARLAERAGAVEAVREVAGSGVGGGEVDALEDAGGGAERGGVGDVLVARLAGEAGEVDAVAGHLRAAIGVADRSVPPADVGVLAVHVQRRGRVLDVRDGEEGERRERRERRARGERVARAGGVVVGGVRVRHAVGETGDGAAPRERALAGGVRADVGLVMPAGAVVGEVEDRVVEEALGAQAGRRERRGLLPVAAAVGVVGAHADGVARGDVEVHLVGRGGERGVPGPATRRCPRGSRRGSPCCWGRRSTRPGRCRRRCGRG